MKIVSLGISTLICGCSFAQTAIIAHKSHSGTAMDFALADPGNYGNMPVTIERLIRINDTVVEAETNGWGANRLIINNQELQNSFADSVKVVRMAEYELDIMLGRDTASKVIYLRSNEAPLEQLEKLQTEKKQQQIEQKQTEKTEKAVTNSKKQKKSSLLYFGLILGLAAIFGIVRKKLLRA